RRGMAFIGACETAARPPFTHRVRRCKHPITRWQAFLIFRAARETATDLFFSEDDGTTWGEPLRVTAKNEINAHLLRLKDGRPFTPHAMILRLSAIRYLLPLYHRAGPREATAE